MHIVQEVSNESLKNRIQEQPETVQKQLMPTLPTQTASGAIDRVEMDMPLLLYMQTSLGRAIVYIIWALLSLVI